MLIPTDKNLVERLRKTDLAVCKEAIAEIERLNATIRVLNKTVANFDLASSVVWETARNALKSYRFHHQTKGPEPA